MQKTTMAVAIALGMASITVTAASGVTFGGDFTYDFSMVSGEENGNASRALLNLDAEFDLSSILGDGASFTLGTAFQRGNGVSELEDAQGFDNIDADNFEDLYEIVLQFTLNESGIIKIGQQDANTDFAAPEFAGEFINSSMGFSPTVVLPTYPEPVLAVSYIKKFSNSLTLSFGLFDNANSEDSFDDNFSIVQAGYGIFDKTTIQLGYWRDSALGTGDIYVIVDHRFRDDLVGFAQFGSADMDIVGIEYHIGFGIQKDGVFTGEDIAGLGYTQVSDNNTEEGVIDVFYGQNVSDWLNVKADLQYISSPGLNDDIDSALAFTLRFTSEF
jgi:porin